MWPWVCILGVKVLGLWIAESEGASNLWFAFWMGVLNELRCRGVEDILIAYMDGLTGFPEGVRSVCSPTRVQWTCSITWLVIEQVLQNAPHFAVFYRNLFKNFSF
jgi:transposase-like protein